MKLRNVILVMTIILLSGCSTIKFVNLEPYKRIITVQDKNKDEIYILSNCWLVESFVSAESVIEFQDKEAGKIIGKCLLSPVMSLADPTSRLFGTGAAKDYTFKCVISVDAKDGAARITFIVNERLSRADSENLRLRWMSLADELEMYLNKETIKW
ncbi:MAG: DUF4468 domain-containing protein [Prevotellaceae bacterium]|jgi:hypothetical protein|nr:DUF4468 domain-containing protein [Prevotellaceae bacterium]